jgi:hypothetical protein
MFTDYQAMDQVAPLLYHMLWHDESLTFRNSVITENRHILAVVIYDTPLHLLCQRMNGQSQRLYCAIQGTERSTKGSLEKKKLLECARNIGTDQSGPFLDNVCKVLHVKTG